MTRPTPGMIKEKYFVNRQLFALLGSAAAVFAALPASAALPPQHQRLAELRSVLGHRDVVAAFGSTPIDRVEHIRHDLYRVTGGDCHVDVAIVTVGAGRRGPRQFEARPGPRVCR